MIMKTMGRKRESKEEKEKRHHEEDNQKREQKREQKGEHLYFQMTGRGAPVEDSPKPTHWKYIQIGSQ